MIIVKLVLLPLRVALGTAKFGAKTGYRAGRVLGYRRLFFFGTGVAVGLLVAPWPGRQLREKLRAAASGRLGVMPDNELGERVRFELSHSPRTWHLPQPEVEVEGGTVVLQGSVPDAGGRADLGAAAAAVPGVSTVDNRVTIAGGNGSSG